MVSPGADASVRLMVLFTLTPPTGMVAVSKVGYSCPSSSRPRSAVWPSYSISVLPPAG